MKKVRIDETEYAYVCAKIRAMENRLPTMARLERLIDASGAEVGFLLKELGLDVSCGIDEALDLKLSSELTELLECVPSESVVKLFLYQYDCNNLKTLIKSKRRGVSHVGMLFPCGSVSEESAVSAFESGDFSAYPQSLSAAASEAASAFASTGNPQTVDVLLDRACYLDMLEAAKPHGRVYEWIKMKVDAINSLICLRLIRMGGVAAEELLDDMLLYGGDIPLESFKRSLKLGERELAAALKGSALAPVGEELERNERISLGEAEKSFDDLYMSVVKRAKFLPFGAEIVAAYMIALEYAFKNLRIILAGKEASLDGEVIRGMLRENYV